MLRPVRSFHHLWLGLSFTSAGPRSFQRMTSSRVSERKPQWPTEQHRTLPSTSEIPSTSSRLSSVATQMHRQGRNAQSSKKSPIFICFIDLIGFGILRALSPVSHSQLCPLENHIALHHHLESSLQVGMPVIRQPSKLDSANVQERRPLEMSRCH